MRDLERDILQTLIYYDIWGYPLTAEELFAFLPHNSISLNDFKAYLGAKRPESRVREADGYFFVNHRSPGIVAERRLKERRARMMWRSARFAMHIIKRFPFTRGVFVSGELSKNVASPGSDVDFFIVTAPNRLWIARSLLTLFKKIVLLNSKKFFCLNYFVSADRLICDERNLYAAAEVAHVKPLFNRELFAEYIQANAWIREFFPNFDVRFLPSNRVNERRSLLQRVLEWPFSLISADRLDTFLQRSMERVWSRRYPEFDSATRQRLFRCTRSESRVHPLNFQDKVLTEYNNRLEVTADDRSSVTSELQLT